MTTKTKKRKLEKVNFKLLNEMLARLPQVPDGKLNGVEITHKDIAAGEDVQIVSYRNAIFMGQRQTIACYKHPITVTTLSAKEHGIWMTNHPCEIWQMREVIKQAHGDVLIGGLGLGCVSHLVSQSNMTTCVTTVEKSEDILELVSPYVDDNVSITADLFEFLKTEKHKFDFAFFDIWQSTGEWSWSHFIVPLRRLCRTRGMAQRNVLCWNEEEMKGQMRQHLQLAAYRDKPTSPHVEPLRLFAQHLMVASPTAQTAANLMNTIESGRENKSLNQLIERYLSPGTDSWERDFGEQWDRCNPNKKEK